VIRRKSSLEAIIRIFNPKVDAPNLISNVRNTNGDIENRYYVPKDRVKMKTMSFGLRYKWYAGDAISPIGIYQMFGLEYSRAKFEFEDDSFSWYKGNLPNRGPKYKNPDPNTSSIVIVSYGFGKQYALGNTLLMNLGIELGLPFRFPLAESSLTNADWADDNTAIAIRNHALINVTLGFALAL
jgi:hypothetical protein